MTDANEMKLKEMIFEDPYAHDEYEAFKKEFGENSPSVKELETAVKWYYNMVKESLSNMSLKFLSKMIERQTLSPLYNNEEDWVPSKEYPNDIWTHKRRSTVMRIKGPEGKYAYIDIDNLDVYDQDMKRLPYELTRKISLGLTEIEFPYMYTGKQLMFVILSGDVVKIVSVRTPQGKTIEIGKCFKISDTIDEITEEEFTKAMIINSGKEAIKKAQE